MAFLTVLVLLFAAALCCCLVDAQQVQPVCTLTSSPSGVSYNLQSPQLGTQTNGITDLPSGYVKAYINFCDPAPQCVSTNINPYACLVDANGGVLPLCRVRPVGQFIDPLYPQLGANYSCDAYKVPGTDLSYQLHGVITCGPSDIPGIGFAALYTASGLVGAPIGIDFVNPVRKYCDNSGTKA